MAIRVILGIHDDRLPKISADLIPLILHIIEHDVLKEEGGIWIELFNPPPYPLHVVVEARLCSTEAIPLIFGRGTTILPLAGPEP